MQNLPILSFRKQIVDAIRTNPVVIITAETGAGKSTQVPQFLMEEGWDIVVTQPRRLAAQTIALRVAEERGETPGRRIGYRTSEGRLDSMETTCLFCTDGLALVRELMQSGTHQVLVIDEVHEWNVNIEVLVAWTRLQQSLGVPYKLVLMSATLESEALSRYFNDAPIINVPGRTFPVHEQAPEGTIEDGAAMLLKQGRHVLLFQPGNAAISRSVEKLQTELGSTATILPLHGDMSPEEQAACFEDPTKPTCIVATNIAQVSLTIPFIDAVVDSGEERRVQLMNGIEGLFTCPISLADREQRKGRAGRVKEGIYIDYSKAKVRQEFPTPEILRSRLDQLVLRFAFLDLDLETLRFFHQPDLEEIRESKRALHFLQCIDSTGQVTDLGLKIALLPVSVRCGRMLFEAEKLKVVDDTLTLIALLVGGEITDHKNLVWQKLCEDERSSDLFAQLVIYQTFDTIEARDLTEYGIVNRAFAKVKAIRTRLVRALSGKISFESTANRENLLKVFCGSWLDNVYFAEDDGHLYSATMESRVLSKSSVIRNPRWLIGVPWDVGVQPEEGVMFTLRLLQYATRLDEQFLLEFLHSTDLDLSAVKWIEQGITLPDGRHVAVRNAEPAIEEKDQAALEEVVAIKRRLEELHSLAMEKEWEEALSHRIEVFRFSLVPQLPSRLQIWLREARETVEDAEIALLGLSETPVPTTGAGTPEDYQEIDRLEGILAEIDQRLAVLRAAQQLIGKAV